MQTTRYIRLPGNKSKLVITHHQVVTRRAPGAPLKSPAGQLNSEVEAEAEVDSGAAELRPAVRGSEAARAGELERAPQTSDIIELAEDDNFERVFATNSTRRPFRIAQLGGYDPERDFDEAAAELGAQDTPADEPQSRPAPSSESASLEASPGAAPEPDSDDSDIGPLEAEELAPEVGLRPQRPKEPLEEESSETDEVTFGSDSAEPYQTDLEAEMRQQQFDRVGQFLGQAGKEAEQRRHGSNVRANRDQMEIAPQTRHGAHSASGTSGARAKLHRLADSDEGGWVNDGIEDMEIPSQVHQDMILDKASERARKQEEENDNKHNQHHKSALLGEAPAAASSSREATLGAGRAPLGSKLEERDEEAGGRAAKDSSDDGGQDEDDGGGGEQQQVAGSGQAGRRRHQGSTAAWHDGLAGNGGAAKGNLGTEIEEPEDKGASGAEEVRRMPNANYLRSDLIDDDDDFAYRAS